MKKLSRLISNLSDGPIVELMAASAVVVVLLTIVTCGVVIDRIKKADEPSAFSAWCKLHQRTDITFEEWKVLRRNYLLPGDTEREAIERSQQAEATAAAAMGAATGSGS